MKGKRQANFELLRIVAMLMIISLHYLVKGGVVLSAPFVAKENPVGVLAWLIEAFCIVAVNCYVLISGYFGMESVWKPGRVVSLLCQVLFYSLLIPALFLLFGAASARELGFFSLGKTIFPVPLVTDRFGYDFGWFLCLFVTAGYIRLYGISWLEKQSHAAAAYLLSSLFIWLLALCSNTIGSEIEAFAYYADMPYTYNHLLCLISAVSLFYLFKNMRIREGRFADAVRKLAPYTFGVYLLHEHNLVRYAWMNWLGVEKVSGSFWFVPHMIGCVLLVYVIGTAVDMARAWVFWRAAAVAGSVRGRRHG